MSVVTPIDSHLVIGPSPGFPTLERGEAGNRAIDANPFSISQLPSIWTINTKMSWLIDTLIPESAVTLLTGESGCGKSTLALVLAGAVAHGESFLGYKTKQRDVVIVDKENGAGIYHARLERLKIDKTPRLNVWGMWNEQQPGGPMSPALLEFTRDHHRPLIVFDSLIAFHPGSEQDSSETRKYMNGFRRLASLGATVLVIHHTGKGENSKEYRGSSDIKASADAGFVLSARQTGIESLKLKEFKQREGGGVLRTIGINLVDGGFVSSGDNALGIVHGIIASHPGIKSSEIVSEAMLKGASKHRVEAILRAGEGESFEVTKGAKNAKCYSLRPFVN